MYFNRVSVKGSGPRERSGYRALLRAGRSGDRIPVIARFSTTVQTGFVAHPSSYTMGTGSYSRRESGRIVALTTHTHLALRLTLKNRASYI
jgi:hypothetical protein